jgi:hypothetical protein
MARSGTYSRYTTSGNRYHTACVDNVSRNSFRYGPVAYSFASLHSEASDADMADRSRPMGLINLNRAEQLKKTTAQWLLCSGYLLQSIE